MGKAIEQQCEFIAKFKDMAQFQSYEEFEKEVFARLNSISFSWDLTCLPTYSTDSIYSIKQANRLKKIKTRRKTRLHLQRHAKGHSNEAIICSFLCSKAFDICDIGLVHR